METWRSKLNSKYSKQDIERWDVKLKAELKDLKRQVHNKRCFDCNAEDVTWASPKLGIFICVTCSDVHRAAGAHITCVKNFNTYLWGPDEVALMKSVGNSRGRELYGAETILCSADKNAKVAYCTKKYGSAEVQELVRIEMDAAKASTEARLFNTETPQAEDRLAPTQLQHNTVQGCVVLDGARKHAIATKGPVEDDGKLSKTVRPSPHGVHIRAPKGNGVDRAVVASRASQQRVSSEFDAFLDTCFSAVDTPAAKVAPEVDVFDDWEHFCAKPIVETKSLGRRVEKKSPISETKQTSWFQAVSSSPQADDLKCKHIAVPPGPCKQDSSELDDFLTACNAHVEKPAAKAGPEIDLFAGWESWS